MNYFTALPGISGLPAWMQFTVWTSLQASVLAILVLAIQPLLRRAGVAARWRFLLWMLVMARFVPVALPESRWSVMNWFPHQVVPQPAHLQVAGVDHHTAAPAAAPVSPRPEFAMPVATGQRPAFAVSPVMPINSDLTHPAMAPRDAVLSPTPPAVPAAAPGASAAAKPHIAGDAGVAWSRWWLPSFYLLGAAAVLLRLAMTTRALWRMIDGAVVSDDAALAAALASARRTFGIRRKIPILLSDRVSGPALVGLLHPQLLLPESIVDMLSPQELRHVFLHECAHLRRRDVLLNYLVAGISVIQWFNPLLWLVLPRIRAERELATDELVLMRTADAASYGHTLLKLLQATADAISRPRLSPGVPGAAGLMETRAFFTRRIHMIAGFRKQSAWVAIPVGAALMAAAVVTLTAPLSKAAQEATGQTAEVPLATAGRTVRSFKLEHVQPQEALKQVRSQFTKPPADKGVYAGIDANTHTLTVNAPDSEIEKVAQLVSKLDGASGGEPAAPPVINAPAVEAPTPLLVQMPLVPAAPPMPAMPGVPIMPAAGAVTPMPAVPSMTADGQHMVLDLSKDGDANSTFNLNASPQGMTMSVGREPVMTVGPGGAVIHAGGRTLSFTAPAIAQAVQDPSPLDNKIPVLTVDQQPLTKVLDYLRDAANVNMAVNWDALSHVNIDRNTPISISLKDVPLRKALHLVLDFGAGGSGVLDFDYEDSVITVSTIEDLAKKRALAQNQTPQQRDLTAAIADLNQTRQDLASRISPDSPVFKAAQEQMQQVQLQLAQAQQQAADAQTRMQQRSSEVQMDQRLQSQEDQLRSMEQERAALEAAQPPDTDKIKQLSARMSVVQQQIADLKSEIEKSNADHAVAAKKAEHLTRDYDVRSLVGAGDQAAVLNADQRAAVDELVGTLSKFAGPGGVVSSFNGTVVVSATQENQNTIQAMIEDFLHRESDRHHQGQNIRH